MKFYKYYLIALGVILVDQAIKMLVHFNMTIGLLGEIKILGDWFKLHYTLNPGMAFGIEIWGNYGKLVLSLFRLVAVSVIAWYIYTLYNKKAHEGFIICMSLILGGAIGNVIDSALYGVLPFINNAPYDAVTPWFHGQVIDMFYIDIWEGYLPESFPIWGGQYMSFWPIFNFADASIFCGVVWILIKQKSFLETESVENSAVSSSTEVSENQV